MRGGVHVELGEAGGAEGVAAVDHDPGDVFVGVVVLLAELAFLLVQQLVDEFVYFLPVEVRRVLRLLEEEGRRVLQFLHLFKSKI